MFQFKQIYFCCRGSKFNRGMFRGWASWVTFLWGWGEMDVTKLSISVF